jgi:hypothetical protein
MVPFGPAAMAAPFITEIFADMLHDGIRTYIGTLPAGGDPESVRPMSIKSPNG